jgi:rubrerythrin
MDQNRLKELLLQSLEHENGGVKVYAAALECVRNDSLREEFERYALETETHVRVLQDAFKALGLDPDEKSPGRDVVRETCAGLVKTMEKARAARDPVAAQIVACECVVYAETKDHLDWQLIGKAARSLSGPAGEALMQAYAEVEDQEDEHLYHSRGWCRELWLESLGLPAMLPPPEEKRRVGDAVSAARVEEQRTAH